eukprot:748341-Hanusia_phi.AAC.1
MSKNQYSEVTRSEFSRIVGRKTDLALKSSLEMVGSQIGLRGTDSNSQDLESSYIHLNLALSA